MKSKSIIRQLTETPIHVTDPDDDFYGDDRTIAEVILTKNKITVKDIISGNTFVLSDPVDVDAVWTAFLQVTADDDDNPDDTFRRCKIETNVPHSIAHQVVRLGQPVPPESVDADIGAILNVPAVKRIFSDHILKDLIAAERSDANRVFVVTKAMVRLLAKDYHIAKVPADHEWGAHAAVLSATKAFGAESVTVKVKNRDDDDEVYRVFARSGPEFDKLVRTITRDTTSRF